MKSIAVILLMTSLGHASAISTDPGFTVVRASSRLVDGVHLVNATIRFRFSDDAIEAMDNGVAITVSLRMEVLRERPLLDERVAAVRARYRIQAHALSQRYVVRSLSTDESMTFQSYDAMIDGLGTITDFPLLDDRVLEDGERYRARMKASLDIESLPAPMRLLAYLSTSWRLASDWKAWPLAR